MFTVTGIAFGVVITLILGIFFGLAIWCSEMSIVSKIIIHLIIIVCFFLIAAMGMSQEDKNWNDGKCVKCETPYIPYARNKHGTTYYYCPNCLFETSK